MIFFQIVRLTLILWSMAMISATESVAIRTEGQVELENSHKGTYAKVLTLAVGSFLGDAAYHLRKSKRDG
jgi:hypothetical protein